MGVERHEGERGRMRVVLRRLWRGRTDDRPRATWRLVVPVAVLIAVAAVGARVLAAVDLPDALLNAPGNAVLLVGLTGAVVTTRRLGDRSLADLGFGLGAGWGRDFVVGAGAGVLFQAVVTVLWAATGGLTVTATLASGGATDAASVAVATVATLFAFLVVALWEEFVFRGLLVRNVAEGLAARDSSPTGAILVAGTVSAVVFALLHGGAAAATLTSPTFAVAQAFGAGVYFLAAYVLTGSLALPVGIHFATNVWVRLVVGEAGGAFPALVAAERTTPVGVDALVVVFPPMALLVAFVAGWASYTGHAVGSLPEAYRRVTARSDGDA
jgi:membrane protease YdiL (CAAX protease family)